MCEYGSFAFLVAFHFRFDDVPVGGDTFGAEYAGVGGGCPVERAELAGQLQLREAPRQLHRIRLRLLVGTEVELAEPVGDVGEPAVAVIDVLHRGISAAVCVLDETDDRGCVSCVDEVAEGVDDLEDVLGPAARLGVGNEGAAVAEHRVDSLLPGTNVQRSTSGCEGPSGEPLAEAPVRLDLFEQQVDQLVALETRQVLAQV